MAKSKVTRKPRRVKTAPATCFFCDGKKLPSFKIVSDLEKCLTERGKILARAKTGLCAKHQNDLTKNVKYARHLALLPFVAK